MTSTNTRQYLNPVIKGDHADPTVCRVGEDFYLACSSMDRYPGVPLFHSRDLVHWEPIGHALTRECHYRQKPGDPAAMIYAPTLRYHDGTFYLITTNVSGCGNFYITANDPAGPWSDPIIIDRDMFDPDLFFDDDGKVYYMRRGPWESKGIVQAEIDIKTGRLLTEYKLINTGYVSDDVEAPHLYKKNGYYYLLNAEGGTRYLHMGCIGRSKSPAGPFEPCPHNPVIAQHHAWWHPVRSIGHGDLVQDAAGHWWIFYLATRHTSYGALTLLGRETFLAPVEWRDGWPVVSPEAQRKLEVASDRLPAPHPWAPVPAREDFDAARLGLDWFQIGYPDTAVYSLGERPGRLRLFGQAARPGEAPPVAFVAREQEDFDCEATTQVEFTPAKETEEAGLTVFLVKDFHYDLFVTRRAGQPAVVLRKTVGDMALEAGVVSIKAGPVRLRITSTPEQYEFFFATGGGEWQKVGSGLAQLLASDIPAVFAGVGFGLYSTGNGRKCEQPADFDGFEYRAS